MRAAVVSSGCIVENACVVGALVKLAKAQSLPSCTVVYGAQNTSHLLPRPEAEVCSPPTSSTLRHIKPAD